jgi:predicted Fe-Mo cluster-binding NifX family protein
MRKIAIAAQTTNITGLIMYCPSRAPFFCVLDEDKNYYFIQNPTKSGTNTTHTSIISLNCLFDEGVELLIANHFGPGVQQIAKHLGIQLLSPPRNIQTIESIIQQFNFKIMPDLNRKGPEGKGSGTGRKQGKCNPGNKGLSEEEIRNKQNQGQGKGLGRGAGKGNGTGMGNRGGKGRGMGRRSQ